MQVDEAGKRKGEILLHVKPDHEIPHELLPQPLVHFGETIKSQFKDTLTCGCTF